MKRKRRTIDRLSTLASGLLAVEKPARYMGGEVGSIGRGAGEEELVMALSFPDLYEIGMSNNAIRILYSELNSRAGLRCERVFAPAPDFEALLLARDLPLFTLESGLALCDVDILGFSLGYELAATSILSILKTGQIPLLAAERGEGDPIVIMGGPAISNPHPFSRFIDAAYIGEAEASFFDLMVDLSAIRKQGGGRIDLLERMAADSAIWLPKTTRDLLQDAGRKQAKDRALRAIYADFAGHRYRTAHPIATMKVVQEHGTVEIMRGCPNGCRFCHAGYYYRPQRLKPFAVIHDEVENLVKEGGYREITLASLSSGDYPGIETVLDALNAEWGGQGVSFQLPSLKINSFTLPLLEKLSEVRKSGLTFAVETPDDAWQRIINKDVSFEQTVSILVAAKERGFKLAKFYFMIGLPVPGGVGAEVDSIIEFFTRLLAHIPMQLNVNVGTFVPKPHTPFQWAPQLAEEEALAAIYRLKDGLKPFRSLMVSFHSPFVSMLEGIISRGDDRVGELLLSAFEKGARLDAWDEHFNRDLWRSVLEGADWKPIEEACRQRDVDEVLPWDDVSVRVSKAYLKREYEASIAQTLTSRCIENCTGPCGACSDSTEVENFSEHVEVAAPKEKIQSHRTSSRLIFSYRKKGIGKYHAHLSITEAVCRAFLMTGYPVAFSEGFNPMPRLELSQPLPIGVEAEGEIGSMLMKARLFEADPEGEKMTAFLAAINARLPEGLAITDAWEFPVVEGKKIYSVASLSWGALYSLRLAEGEKTLNLADLYLRLECKIAELAIAGASLSLEDQREIRVFLPDPERKELGMLRILDSLLDDRPVQARLAISRVACLARGEHEQGYRGYAEAFAGLAARQ